MNVFISWSGETAKAVGEILYRELPKLIPESQPWISTVQIPPGANWIDFVLQKLESSEVGILCLAGGRINSPWLLFEAGALSGSKSKQKVIPYLIDIQPKELIGPLESLQSVSADKEGTFQLMKFLAQIANPKTDLDSLVRQFDDWWLDIEQAIVEAKSIGDLDNVDFSGQWSYTCTVKSSPHDQWGGQCQIKKRQGLYDSQWQIQGSRMWKHKLEDRQLEKKELLAPLYWESDWFAVVGSSVVKFTYQITTPDGVIRGFSTGNLETLHGRAIRFKGDFYQLAPLQPVFGEMLFERENM